MRKLEGKVAFIAGSAKEIGKAIAECFAAEGACVACADIDAEGASAVAARIEASGGGALAIGCDVTVSTSVAAAVAATSIPLAACTWSRAMPRRSPPLSLWRRWTRRGGAVQWISTSPGRFLSASTRSRR